MITDQLDPSLNWKTLQLTQVAFGSTLITIPADTQHYQTTVPMTYHGTTFDVEVELGLNAATGEVVARFKSIDPSTDLPPDVETGFLPPEDGTGRGMGFLVHRAANVGLATATQNPECCVCHFRSSRDDCDGSGPEHDPIKGPTRQSRHW